MNTPAISIIVPVYNAEIYLRRCIDSILAQSFGVWELLLIDDGSPDNSGAICDQFAQEDYRIKVFHKPNGGVASAREVGMANAKGKYSIHVDPDDWIEVDMLQQLYNKITETDADIVVSDFLFDYGPKHQVISYQQTDGSNLLYDLLCQNLHGSLCNKLIRTDLYHRHDLHFPEEMICWEDLYICCNLAIHTCRVEYIPKAFYHYDLHSNKGSMTRRATMRTLNGMKLFCDYFTKKLDDSRLSWLNETKSIVVITAYRCKLLDEEGLRSLYPEINQWFVNKYGKARKTVMYHGLAMVLKGHSLQYARRIQAINSIVQRFKSKIHKILR